MPPPRFARPKLNGSVTIRRFRPPQLETAAPICKGELTETLAVVAARVGVASSGAAECQVDELSLVDEQGLAVMSKLVDGKVYYVSGGVAMTAGGDSAGLLLGSACSAVGLSAPQPPDCVVMWAFDPRMLLHQPHSNRSPETPYRLQRAVEALQQCERADDILPPELLRPLVVSEDGTLQHDPAGGGRAASTRNRARLIPPRLATPEEIYTFQSRTLYSDFIERGTALPSLKSDVYCNEETSSTAARLSVGAVVDAGAAVLRGVAAVRSGTCLTREEVPLLAYCLVRPPGHHCTASQPSGFCLVNNVAIAAAVLRKTHLAHSFPHVPRIAVLDLDVHFGEGSASFANAVADPATLLYLSLHRYDRQKFYPFDQRGDSAYTGEQNAAGSACGCVCNVAVHTDAHDPLHCERVISDHVMNRVLEDVFLPRLECFQPDVILVSLGFDAAYGDPLGKMAVEGGFASVMARLKRWCTQENEGRVTGLVVVLEGGYNPESVAQGALSVGLALSLPLSDPSVQAAVQERPPRVWADLRQRQLRQLREFRQVMAEREEDDSESAQKAGRGVGGVDGAQPPPPPQVADDDTLLARHVEWCAALVSSVKQMHRAAAEGSVRVCGRGV